MTCAAHSKPQLGCHWLCNKASTVCQFRIDKQISASSSRFVFSRKQLYFENYVQKRFIQDNKSCVLHDFENKGFSEAYLAVHYAEQKICFCDSNAKLIS